MMLKILCFCVFVANFANAFNTNNNEFSDNATTAEAEDELKTKMLSYFEQSSSSWVISPHDSEAGEVQERGGYPFGFEPAINIIQPPKIKRYYFTEIRVQQVTHPFLFRVMQMIPIKTKQTFDYIYKKLFKYFMAIEKFTKPYVLRNRQIIQKMLEYIFPEWTTDQIQSVVVLYPVDYQMLLAVFKIMFPGLPQHDWELLVSGPHTVPQLIVNLFLYLCPNIKEHIYWKDDLPIYNKLKLILEMLFPGVSIIMKGNDFQDNIYTLLESLFHGKLILKTEKKLEGPLWIDFQQQLKQNHIDMKQIPKDYLFYLYANFQTPQFQLFLPKIRDKFMHQVKKMDPETMKIWGQYLKDLETHQKTLNDMPPEIKVFLKQCDNPKELIKLMSQALGFPVDYSKLNIPLDPKIEELWKKFIFDLMRHNGDTTHLPKPLLEYFYSLSQNPNYKYHLEVIFDGLSINPHLVGMWHQFFDQLRDGHITLDQMPQELRTFLMDHQRPEEFLRIILKLKDSRINTNFLNITPKPEMLQLWKKYVEDVAANKGNISYIPSELLKYFYEISSNPDYVNYIKLVFESDRVNPKTLNIWNNFIGKLKLHQVDLKDMPSELIQLMLKYKSPDEFFKVVLPQYKTPPAIPNDVVKEQWQDLTHNIQNSSLEEVPKELKDFVYKFTPSKNYQDTLQQIYSVNPDLLRKWKLFMEDLKQHKTFLMEMPDDLKSYLYEMEKPEEFTRLIFQGMEPPLDEPIPDISDTNVTFVWKLFKAALKGPEEPVDLLEIKVSFLIAGVAELMKNATENPRYQQEVSYIFQMDPKILKQLEDFKAQMATDYNVSISSMPKMLALNFMMTLSGTYQSILDAYPGNHKIKATPLKLHDQYLLMLIAIQSVTGPKQSDIDAHTMFFIKYYAKDTPLEAKIDEVIKLHDGNRLITKVERLWNRAKRTTEVHDGVEVFTTFLENLGELYANSEELCDRRSTIVEALERAKQGFAARSNCTYEDLFLMEH